MEQLNFPSVRAVNDLLGQFGGGMGTRMMTSVMMPVLGISEIDAQHARLWEVMERLQHWSGTAFEIGALFDAAESLHQYVHDHFAYEEAMLEELGYPELDSHAAEHARYSAELDRIVAQMMEGAEINDLLLTMLRRWIIEHIGVHDQEYVEWINKHGQRSLALWEDATAARLI